MSNLANILWKYFILIVSLNVSEELLLSLDLKHHLAMNVLDIEVFPSDHQGPSIAIDIVVKGVITVPTIGKGK